MYLFHFIFIFIYFWFYVFNLFIVEKTKKIKYNNPHAVKVAPQTNGISYNSPFISSTVTELGKKEGKRKQKLSKSDIGQPQDFRHISHVGWDPNKGFDLEKVDDPQLEAFFAQVITSYIFYTFIYFLFIYSFVREDG